MKFSNAAFAAGLVVLLFAGLVNAGLAYSEGKGSSSAPFKTTPPVAFGYWPKYPFLPCNKETIQTKRAETYLACSEQANVTISSTGFKINVITHVGANVRVACYYNGQLVSGWPRTVRWNHVEYCSAGGRLVSLDHKGPVLFWRHVSNPKDYMGFVFVVEYFSADSLKPANAALGDASLSADVTGSVSGSTFADSAGLNADTKPVGAVQSVKRSPKKTVVKTAKKVTPRKKVSSAKRVRKLRVKKVLRKPPVKRVYRIKALRKRR